MAVFAISDLHLPGGEPESKSMTVFGERWRDYVSRIETNWRAVVGEDDTVVLPGDISWAMTLDGALDDMRFIDSLPGKKLIGKGNHDFWWATLSKMRGFLRENGFFSIDFLQNNAYAADGLVICGTRGWFFDERSQADVYDTSCEKLIAREVARLELSYAEAMKLSGGDASRIRVFLHFPAVFGSDECRPITSALYRLGVGEVYYGHVHTASPFPLTRTHGGIRYHCISSDALGFMPTLVR